MLWNVKKSMEVALSSERRLRRPLRRRHSARRGPRECPPWRLGEGQVCLRVACTLPWEGERARAAACWRAAAAAREAAASSFSAGIAAATPTGGGAGGKGGDEGGSGEGGRNGSGGMGGEGGGEGGGGDGNSGDSLNFSSNFSSNSCRSSISRQHSHYSGLHGCPNPVAWFARLC